MYLQKMPVSMLPIPRLLDKLIGRVRTAAVAACLVVPAFSQVIADSSEADVSRHLPLGVAANPVDTLSQELLQQTISPSIKSVLYLGGGERSPWFYLGVLYAIEEYGVPVDSVVGTSWGALVGSLWSRGLPLDEIQRILLDSAVVNFVGKDLSREQLFSKDGDEFYLSLDGVSSLRQRFTLQKDSSGNRHRRFLPLQADSLAVKRGLAKLRLQESLYRQRSGYKKPFSVLGCNGESLGNSIESVMESLPLWNGKKISGELCPHFAYPAEDRPDETALIAVAEPLRSEVAGDARDRILYQQASEHLVNQPGVIIRAHTILDTAKNAWIQAGFSAVERRLQELKNATKRREDYSAMKTDAAKPWFRFTPAFDQVSSELHTPIKTHWTQSDTGFVAPTNFAYSLAETPAYDSLTLTMQPDGNLMVGAAVHPVYELAAGGFGSNALGANAYLEASLNFVTQMEIELVLKGFWGSSSYGVGPHLRVARLLNRHWSLNLGYDFMVLRPLKSFNNDILPFFRVQTETRHDFAMSIVYQLDENQNVLLDLLFERRFFDLDPSLYGKRTLKTYPVNPMIRYTFNRGGKSPWYSLDGFSIDVGAGMESIGFNFGIADVVPIFWKFMADARFTVSPTSYTTFTVGASGGVQRYHEEGHGYVYPRSFDCAPIDVAYQFHAAATPWSLEWYNPELSSHEYALLRGSASLHGKYFGLWLFAAYYHDFENGPYTLLNQNRFILEPTLRFAYKSIDVSAGISRVVDTDSFKNLKELKDYTYFIKVGTYRF